MRTRNRRSLKKAARRSRLAKILLGIAVTASSASAQNGPCPPLADPCQPCAPEMLYAPGIQMEAPIQQAPMQTAPAPLSDGSSLSEDATAESQAIGDSFLNDGVATDVSDAELNQFANEIAEPIRASGLASTSGSQGGLNAPNMLGDFFGGTFTGGSPIVTLPGATVSLAGGDRRFKVSENTSPLPTDRVFGNYNHFHNALVDANGRNQHLDRFVLGFEKTFWAKQASFEMRLPMLDGLDSTQVDGSNNTTGTEFGNLAMSLKFLLSSSQNSALSAGLTATVPTGDDFLSLPAGGGFTRIENEAVHLAPFVGYLRSSDEWFLQSYLQLDVDLNGNDVISDAGFQGTLQDQNLLFADLSLGRWLARGCDSCGNMRGVALISELHYMTTVNDTDDVAGFSNNSNRMDILNATFGLHFQRGLSSLRVGVGAPLRDGNEALYDSEIMVQMNRRF